MAALGTGERLRVPLWLAPSDALGRGAGREAVEGDTGDVVAACIAWGLAERWCPRLGGRGCCWRMLGHLRLSCIRVLPLWVNAVPETKFEEGWSWREPWLG